MVKSQVNIVSWGTRISPRRQSRISSLLRRIMQLVSDSTCFRGAVKRSSWSVSGRRSMESAVINRISVLTMERRFGDRIVGGGQEKEEAPKYASEGARRSASWLNLSLPGRFSYNPLWQNPLSNDLLNVTVRESASVTGRRQPGGRLSCGDGPGLRGTPLPTAPVDARDGRQTSDPVAGLPRQR